MTKTRLGLVALLALAALAGACSGGALTASSIACEASTDCADGRVCDFNYCVAPGENRTVVMARIIPPANSDLLTQQIPALTFDAGSDWLIRLLEPVVLRGSVTPTGDSFTVNVPGELVVTTPGDIAGLDYSFSTRSVDGLDVNGDGFTLRVLPGRTYAGTFRPDNAALPNYTFTLTPDVVATGRYDVMLPAAAEYVTIGGRVRAQDYTPVGDARVVALLADDSVAGVTTTDSVHGFFSLTLPPSAAAVRLKVSAPSAGPVFPDFTTEPLTPAADVDVEIPTLPAGSAPIEAKIQVLSRDPFGIVQYPTGLTVTIVGELAQGTLRRSGTTDADGVVTLTVLPGAYECLVTTGPESIWANWHGRVTLASHASAASKAPVTVELSYRTPLFGTVSDGSGGPVASGTIYATRRVERGAHDLLAIAPPPFKKAISAGSYQLDVDPGVYDLRVVPDASTGAPPLALRAVTVASVPLELPVELPEPALAHLTVARPDGTFMSGVTVELYQPDPTTAEPVLLTKGTTSDAGYVDLLIPYSP
ncbi:MAG: hypothetical protein CVU56_26265 [Deltaproteobacteria bacterium HGW-Deltaproteobacteria-14]|jgi:hypothetical protein|nr:MAG: hypothetical protein CVU56_26265 [Deltaproteobacteria bacterium HGW-Deltaproteobacteria-14]